MDIDRKKYHSNPAYRRYSSKDDNVTDLNFNIDAKLNGAYIILGLLYGEGDPLKTITIAMRSGQDSDCNPSNAAGILFAMLGYDHISSDFTDGLDEHEKFSFTPYDFPTLIDVSEKLAREVIIKSGGSIETDADGKEIFVIPVGDIKPSEFVQSWDPGPTANTTYTDAQMAQIRFPTGSLKRDVQRFAPDWDVIGCLDNPHLGLKRELLGRKNVLFTLPASRKIACRLITTINLPSDAPKVLRLIVSNFPGGDWKLIVKANGQKLLDQIVSDQTTIDGWLQVDVDLSIFAGQATHLELLNQAYGRSWEGGYWATVEVIDTPS